MLSTIDASPRAPTPSPLARACPVLPARCPYCGGEMRLMHRHPGPAAHVWGCGSAQCSFEVRDYDGHQQGAVQLLLERVLRLEAQQAWHLVQMEELFARVEALSVRTEIESARHGEE